MPRYAITEKAGRFVAGQNNVGVGTILTLTEKQAEHEVRLGTLVPVDLPVAEIEAAQPAPEPAQGGEEAPKASNQRRGKKAAPAPAQAAAEGDAETNGDGEPEGDGDDA